MAYTQRFTCTVCGKTKGCANHWFLAVCDKRGLTLYPWKDDDAKLENMLHLCGRECVNRIIDKALDSSVFGRPEPAKN